MTFLAPRRIPEVAYPPYSSHHKHAVGTLNYDQDYSYDLTATKVELRNLLKQNDLSAVQAGFPFRCVQNSSGESHISYASYEFRFRERLHGMDKRTLLQSAILRYSSSSSRSGQMNWTVTVPERLSSCDPRRSPGMIEIARVQVDPLVMETPFVVTLMTNTRVIQEALALSIELGTPVTVEMAKTLSTSYGSGQILFSSANRPLCTFQL